MSLNIHVNGDKSREMEQGGGEHHKYLIVYLLQPKTFITGRQLEANNNNEAQ